MSQYDTKPITKETVTTLRELLTYNPDTGELLRKSKRKSGGITPSGYVRIMVNAERYLVHRIIMAFHLGSLEAGIEIDHINGVRHDNRLVNLRTVTRAENGRNQKLRSTNKSGVMGVSFDKRWKIWRVEIGREYLSCHKNFNDAMAARIAAEVRAGYHPNHGRTSG